MNIYVTEDIVTGHMPKPMLIKKDSHGETHIEEVKGAAA